jgi:two-component system, OmpR family, sensor kinase
MISEPRSETYRGASSRPGMSRGLVARFTRDGELIEALVDPLGRLAGGPGCRFLDLLDEGSRAKGATLLERVAEEGSASAWELLLADDPGTALRFTIAAADDHLLVFGDPAGDGLEQVLDGLTGINNLTVNRVRELEGDQARLGGQLEDYGALNSELVNLHRELARRTAQLEEAIEQKNQLIGMAAHDLRNPIGAIRGFAQLLLSRVSDRLDEREHLVLERIERSSDHMLDLVNDLLQLAELDRTGLSVVIEVAEVDVAALVAESVEVEAVLAEQKDITIELELGTDVLVAFVDGRKLEQVLANLLSNALKFSDRGSRVEVALRLEGEVVILEVRDEGPGIPEEDQDRIFEPFARANARPTAGERSTGLGLAIVRRVVEGHGGRIEVDTEVDVGSTFRVLLPRTPQSEVPPVRPSASSGTSSPARSQATTDRIWS